VFDVNARNGLLKGKNFLKGCDADAVAGCSQPTGKRKSVLIAVKKNLGRLKTFNPKTFKISSNFYF
jgi:hypothetical protein